MHFFSCAKILLNHAYRRLVNFFLMSIMSIYIYFAPGLNCLNRPNIRRVLQWWFD